MAEPQHPAQPKPQSVPQSPLPPAPVLPSSAGLLDPALPPVSEPVRTEPSAVRRTGADAVLAPFPAPGRKVPEHAGGPFPGAFGPAVHRTNGFAIAAFVAGLVGMVVLAPVFSIVALRRIRRTGDRGRSLAITALMLTGCWLAVIALIAALAVWGNREAGVGNSTPVANIRVGQCFDADLGKSTLLVAKIADCTGPHAGEAYATASASLAGLDDNEKDLSAAQSCANSFEGFVGGPYDKSELDIFFVVLQDDESAGGNVLCMLGTPGKELTGSMRGTGR